MSSTCHPPLDFILSDKAWQPYDSIVQTQQFSAHCEALSRPGLFTDHLASLNSGGVGIELVQQKALADLDGFSRRDVRILTGNKIVAIASTLIPGHVLSAETWLQTLGNQPIGEALEKRLGAERKDISYAAIPLESDLFKNFEAENALWGRRYRYTFATGDLSITEIIADSVVAKIFKSFSTH